MSQIRTERQPPKQPCPTTRLRAVPLPQPQKLRWSWRWKQPHPQREHQRDADGNLQRFFVTSTPESISRHVHKENAHSAPPGAIVLPPKRPNLPLHQEYPPRQRLIRPRAGKRNRSSGAFGATWPFGHAAPWFGDSGFRTSTASAVANPGTNTK